MVGGGCNHSKCTDSHCGPNYTFIVEHFSQLLSDKTLVAKGQQLIAVIKPPFDFICSDGTKHDRRASDRQSRLLLFHLPLPQLLHERSKVFQVCPQAFSRAARVRLVFAKQYGRSLFFFIINKAQRPQSRATLRLIFFSPYCSGEQLSVAGKDGKSIIQACMCCLLVVVF